MSVDGLTYEFVDIQGVKDFLHIKQTDEEDDQLLRNLIAPAADKFVKNRLFGFADSFPLDSDLHDSAMGAAFKKAVSLYKGHINNLEAAELYEKMAEEDITFIENTLKATATGRTKIVSASKDYDTEDDILFSQSIR